MFFKKLPTLLPTLLLLATVGLISACGSDDVDPATTHSPFSKKASDVDYDSNIENIGQVLTQAEDKASAEGRAILRTAHGMVTNREIILGSCWDYIDAVYTRSKFEGKRRFTFFASKKAGPYADVSTIQGGDWLYIINHSYGDVEHSGIFVDWIDQDKKEAILLSYPGENRQMPARYRVYDLSSVYNIIRAKEVADLELAP